MIMFLALFFSCMVTFEDTDDHVKFTIEQGESSKAFSNKTPLKSSAKIVVASGENILAHGSSNYFKSGKYKFIITAAHVLNHPYESYIADGDELVKLNVLYLNMDNDVAIAVPERELLDTAPKTLRVNKTLDLIGKTTYYAGFPQDLNKALFKGFVSQSGKNAIVMQSFALPGSSGSVVFDFWGRAIGIVSAVKVGVSGVNPFPELVESIVIVQRIGFINHKLIKELFEEYGKK